MAFANECDRCGALYKTTVDPKINIVEFTSQNDYCRIDLCPDCQKELETWLKEKKQ